MRLLIMFPSTIRGGAEGYADTIATAAIQAGWDVHIAFPAAKQTTALAEELMLKGVTYHPLAITEVEVRYHQAVQEHISQCAITIDLIRKIKPDVVQIILPWLNKCLGSIVACALLQIPTALVFQLIPLNYKFSKGRLAIYHWAKAKNQQWIAISEHNRQLISKFFHVPVDEIVLVYNGTNSKSKFINCTFDKVNQIRQQVRLELGLSEHSQLLLTVGRLDAQKGYETLIPAIKPILEKFPSVRFVWVGEGSLRESLIKQLQEYGISEQVLMLGFRKDVSRLLASADLFVFPSLYEGLPFALIEAAAHKLPIIASNASSIPEVINHNIHGLLFKSGNSQALQQSIIWALQHPEAMQLMAETAQLRTHDFSAQKMVSETLTVLQNLKAGCC